MPAPAALPRTATAACVVLHPAFTVGQVDRRLFGSFVEHLGRGVYGGLHDPQHVSADGRGFRGDVLDLVRELGVTTVRYPGGNFVSGYDWQDGVGPLDSRPRRLDPAWHSVETNQFGVDEFAAWCRAAGVEPMLAVNLGTDGIRSALRLLEYVNHPGGTTLSDARRAHGSPDPHDVRLWCLGNEMDGPWQLGSMPAREYGRLAAATGRAMRALDPDIGLVVCGSSNDRMATFGAWEHDVLAETVDVVDYVSCHQYFRNAGDLPTFLASGTAMDRMVDVVAASITQARAAARSEREVAISFDEWNVWDWERHDRLAAEGRLGWDVAPALLEDRYTVADAVVVGDMLLSLVNHCDVVRAASMAQLVNVIGPIVADADGPAWRQTTFHPFVDVRRSAGRTALRSVVLGDRADGSGAPVVAAAAALDPSSGDLDVHLVHRGTTGPCEVELDLSAFGAGTSVEGARLLHDDDPLATCSAEHPERVAPRPLAVREEGGRVRLVLPAVSWASLRLKTRT